MDNQIESVMVEKFDNLKVLALERSEEIARINANPSTRSKVTYEPVDSDTPSHVNAATKANAGSGTKAYLDLGIIRKVTIGAAKTQSRLGDIDREIKSNMTAIAQAIFSQKPATHTRGTGNGGSHAITKAWFDKHSEEYPAGMNVAWDDANNKITYNLPKGGRGATVSHGALTNIVKSFKGQAPSALPADTVEPATPKKVPAKKAGKK